MPDLSKKKADFDKLSKEKQEKIHEEDWTEALAVDKVLTKEKTLSEIDNNWYQFTKSFLDNGNESFSNKEVEIATQELETSVDLIKKEIYELLMQFKNGEHELKESAHGTLFSKQFAVSINIQNSKIVEYLAKQLGGEFVTFKDRPEDSNISFRKIGKAGLYRTTKDGDTQLINHLSLSPRSAHIMEITVGIERT